jgi:hypothetical protein
MAKTSTQVQRAVKNKGEEFVDCEILAYANRYKRADGSLVVAYVTQLYIAQVSDLLPVVGLSIEDRAPDL